MYLSVVLLLLLQLSTTQQNVVYSKDVAKQEHEGFTFLISGGHRKPDYLKNIAFMVSIRTRQPQKFFGDNHFCAGTIIAPSTIVTAAHCVMDKRKVVTRPRRLLVVAGSPNRLRIDQTTRQYPVETVNAHPNYILHNTNDIAVITIKGRIPDDDESIKIITMPKAPPKFGMTCITIGWGRLYYNGPLAAQPSHVELILFSPEECKKKTPHFRQGMLCAGDDVHYNEDPCRGDSGGPLICQGEFTGIISWTIGCGSKDFPSLYTDVYYHLNWIKENNGRLSSESCQATVIIVLVTFNLWH